MIVLSLSGRDLLIVVLSVQTTSWLKTVMYSTAEIDKMIVLLTGDKV